MLSPVLQVGITLFKIKTKRSVRRAGSAIVNSFRIGKKNQCFASLVKAIAPVDVFPVHKELRIQQTDTIQSTPANQHKPAVEDFHGRGALVIEVRHQISTKDPGVLES